MTFMHYYRAFRGIVWRELLRFLQQRERFFAALVRPLIWLIIFAAGFGVVRVGPKESTGPFPHIARHVRQTVGAVALWRVLPDWRRRERGKIGRAHV